MNYPNNALEGQKTADDVKTKEMKRYIKDLKRQLQAILVEHCETELYPLGFPFWILWSMA